MASLESYFRSFLKTPYQNANYIGRGRRRQRGGSLNRFGVQVYRYGMPKYGPGAPGGINVGTIPGRNPELITGAYRTGYGRKRRFRGKGKLTDAFINPGAYHSPALYYAYAKSKF